MRRARLVALLPWLLLAASIISIATTVQPQGGPGAPGAVQPGHPFIQHDPGPEGASLLCVSDRPGRILPPYLAPIDPPTPIPALASNPPPGVAGAL